MTERVRAALPNVPATNPVAEQMRDLIRTRSEKALTEFRGRGRMSVFNVTRSLGPSSNRPECCAGPVRKITSRAMRVLLKSRRRI